MASIIKTDNIQKVSDDSNIIKKCGSTTTVGSGAGNTITVDGATITLGRCGGTVSLASGATQSGFGRSGSVNWCTTAKTSPFTAANGIGYFINTTSGAVTVTLPASPSAGDIVAVQDYANTAQTNNITVARNSSKIDGRCVDGTISVNGEAYTLVYVDGTEGWKTVDNTTQQIDTASFVAATGGNAVVTCGNFKIHVFTSTGALCVSNAGNSTGSNSLEYMVVGGGGGGGRNIPAPNVYGAGGGGAGGWRASSGASPSGPFTAGPAPLVGCVASIPVSVQPYPVTIGAGGAASGGNSNGTSGSNTIFSTITSAGGGGGGGGNQNPGVDGGSGGGGGTGPSPSANTRPGGAGNTPPVSPPQGNTGGTSSYRTSQNFSGGGGGGAGAVGINGNFNCGGLGGTGVGTAIIPNSAPTQPSYGASGPDATLRYFAGGGSGAGLTNATSDPSRIPVGGGGAAGGEYPVGTNVTNGVAGTANTGGGGGAGSTTATAGAGGSGVVLIRYKFQ